MSWEQSGRSRTAGDSGPEEASPTERHALIAKCPPRPTLGSMASPRDFFVSGAFGQPDGVLKRVGLEEGLSHRAAARAAAFQHRIAVAIGDFLDQHNAEIADLARGTNQSEKTVAKVLAGETWASLEMFFEWEVALDWSGLVASAHAGETPTSRAEPISEDQRALGQFYTASNPFWHPAFRDWYRQAVSESSNRTLLEPFAGKNSLVHLLRDAGVTDPVDSYDLHPAAEEVVRRDTLRDFPAGYDVVVTNPPWLSRHFGRRKNLQMDEELFGEYNNLYKAALALCLSGARFVAAIIPESFLTTGLFQERLGTFISFDRPMFEDTEMPSGLALFGPVDSPDFEVFSGLRLLGSYAGLSHALAASEAASRIAFNDVAGEIGLFAVDGTNSVIRFAQAAEIPAEKIKHSARLVSRIAVDGLDPADVEAVIAAANAELAAYRNRTKDVLLTAFKGLRKDGTYRRRLDYATARSLLATAVEKVEAKTRQLRSSAA